MVLSSLQTESLSTWSLILTALCRPEVANKCSLQVTTSSRVMLTVEQYHVMITLHEVAKLLVAEPVVRPQGNANLEHNQVPLNSAGNCRSAMC